MSDVDSGLVKMVLDWLIANYGAGGTVTIFLGACIIWFLFRLYTDWRKDKEVHLTLDEKEKTINRLANDNRELRAMFLKQVLKWSNQDISDLIISNEFKSPKELRDHCEKRTPKKGDEKK